MDDGVKVRDLRAVHLDEELGRSARKGMPMPPSIAKGLVKAMAAAKAVDKRSTNEHHNFKYASMDAVIAEARDALTAGGISVLSEAWEIVTRTVRYLERAEDGTPSHVDEDEDSVVVQYMLVSADGESWRPAPVRTPILPEKGRPPDKALATGLTYNLGYYLRGLLLLARQMPQEQGVDERDDRQYQPKQRGAKAAPKKPVEQPAPPKDAADVRLGFSKLAGTPMGKLRIDQLQAVMKVATAAVNDPRTTVQTKPLYEQALEAAVVLLARIEAASLPLDPATGEEVTATVTESRTPAAPPEETGCAAQEGDVP